MDFEFFGQIPKFKDEDEVFVVVKRKKTAKVERTRIISVPLKNVNIEGKNCLIHFGFYEVNLMFVNDEDRIPYNWVREKYLFSTLEEAEKMAKWYPVDLFYIKWLKALGNRYRYDNESYNIYDDCDLLIGDINDGTSEIRSFLQYVQEDEGMCEVDRLELQAIIDKCPNRPDALDDPSSALSEIFEKLNLEWRKP